VERSLQAPGNRPHRTGAGALRRQRPGDPRTEEVYQTLAALKQEGKILGFGFSGKTVAGGLKALEQGDCAMVTYNLNEQAERPVLDYAAEHGKAILVKKALASGHVCLAPGSTRCRPASSCCSPTRREQCYCRHHQPLHLAHNVATVARILGQPELAQGGDPTQGGASCRVR
jgi:hypothetical protein